MYQYTTTSAIVTYILYILHFKEPGIGKRKKLRGKALSSSFTHTHTHTEQVSPTHIHTHTHTHPPPSITNQWKGYMEPASTWPVTIESCFWP